MDDEAKSVIIDVQRPKEYVNTSQRFFKEVHLNKILKRSMAKRYRRSTRKVSFQKDSSHYDIPLTSKHFKRDELLLLLREYMITQNKYKHKHKLEAIKYDKKYKIIRTVLQKRLHVDYPADDVTALTDTDEGFFKFVNGRSIRDRIPLFKSLKLFFADLLRLKAEIGNRNDCILQIETNIRTELKMYNTSFNRFMAQAKCFESFISEDYVKSRDFLKKWDNLKLKLNMKRAELQNIATQEFTIISRLMGLDYLYSNQQKYGRFLFYLSPPSWRAKNRKFACSTEIEVTGFDLSPSEEGEETFKIVFDKLQKTCLRDFVKPVLYFTTPQTLVDVFEGNEKQQLHHYIYVSHLAPIKKMIKDRIVRLKDKIKQESALVESSIKTLQKLLQFEERRCVKLRNRFVKVLNGLFYESVGAPEVMKLFVHLEFTYERFCFEKHLNMDIVTMARYIENFYMDYSNRLDAIHSNTVKLSVAKCIEKERCKMRKARRAARELHLFEVLQRQLLRAYEPVSNTQSALLPMNKQNRRKSLNRESNKNKYHKTSLNESEIEYLMLFTDWTEDDDTSKYLHVHEQLRMSSEASEL